MTVALEPPTQTAVPRLLWLDLTRKCQLKCAHCFNESGPEGTHGTMTRADWTRVLAQAAGCGVRAVQLIGGEPTMHPDAPDLVGYALPLGLRVEVFSNLVHVSDTWWELLQRAGVSVATSYYSDDAEQHNAITGRPSHQRTRANIEKAVRLGVPLRVGIIDIGDTQRVSQARADLEILGVADIRVDKVRAFGRGARGQAPDMAQLCGRCGSGKATIGPTGDVSPCVMSQWMSVGNIQDAALADILGGAAMAEANASIRAVARLGGACDPDEECSPGSPGSGCTPRA
ncbi:radical SAM protein [Actinomadura rubrisoli]|uniref:radical SAM protein n=1 Tax=Actinomadura rubrisoli TaxID=2530368 RepID=UPI001FB642FB|nr:radical SAM protein [Actinomadura rubrisoli]